MKIYFLKRKHRLKIIIFLMLQILIVFNSREWLGEVFTQNGPLAFYYTDLETLIIKKDTLVTQKFMCVGDGLTQIDCFFSKREGATGFVNITVCDKTGTVVSIPYEYDLSLFEMDELRFPVYMQKALNKGECYELQIATDGIENSAGFEIKVCDKNLYADFLKQDDGIKNLNLMLEYQYDKYLDLENLLEILVLGVLLNMMLMLTISINEKMYKTAVEVILVCVTVGSYFIFELLNVGGDTWDIIRFLANGVPIYLCLRVMYELTKSIKVSVVFVVCLSLFWSISNYYIVIFRGSPVLPWDLKSLTTAMSVAERYSFQCSKELIIVILIGILLINILDFEIEKAKDVCRKEFLIRMGISLSLLCGYIWFLMPNLSKSLWSVKEIYDKQGVVASFLSYSRLLGVDKPKGYSDLKAEELLGNITVEHQDGVKAQNIIVIMNESFADLRVINKDIIQEVMGDSIIDTLEEDVIKGWLYVPTYGANTANTEYEVLTGASMAFRIGVPYQMISNEKYDTIASLLSGQGYYTQAVHPMAGENWNRNKVYSKFGFDEFLALEQMDINDDEILRWFVSDKTNYNMIMTEYEEKRGKDLFLFNVTVQNHGGYTGTYEDFKATVDLSEYGQFPEAENYLSLIKESEKSLQELLAFFSKVEEPTIICFFGDHQPKMGDGFYEKMYGKDLVNLNDNEKEKMYITPFFIWANYDIEEKIIDKMSSNYLGTLILKTANCKMDDYHSYLWKLFQKYPVITANGIWDASGKYYELDEMREEENIQGYSYVQYYRNR